ASSDDPGTATRLQPAPAAPRTATAALRRPLTPGSAAWALEQGGPAAAKREVELPLPPVQQQVRVQLAGPHRGPAMRVHALPRARPKRLPLPVELGLPRTAPITYRNNLRITSAPPRPRQLSALAIAPWCTRSATPQATTKSSDRTA